MDLSFVYGLLSYLAVMYSGLSCLILPDKGLLYSFEVDVKEPVMGIGKVLVDRCMAYLSAE